MLVLLVIVSTIKRLSHPSLRFFFTFSRLFFTQRSNVHILCMFRLASRSFQLNLGFFHTHLHCFVLVSYSSLTHSHTTHALTLSLSLTFSLSSHVTLSLSLSFAQSQQLVSGAIHTPVHSARHILNIIKQSILRGTHVVFSGSFPGFSAKFSARPHIIAAAYGSVVHTSLDREVTHVIAGVGHKLKVKNPAIHVVNINWLGYSVSHFVKGDESQFPYVKSTGGGAGDQSQTSTNHPPALSVSLAEDNDAVSFSPFVVSSTQFVDSVGAEVEAYYEGKRQRRAEREQGGADRVSDETSETESADQRKEDGPVHPHSHSHSRSPTRSHTKAPSSSNAHSSPFKSRSSPAKPHRVSNTSLRNPSPPRAKSQLKSPNQAHSPSRVSSSASSSSTSSTSDHSSLSLSSCSSSSCSSSSSDAPLVASDSTSQEQSSSLSLPSSPHSPSTKRRRTRSPSPRQPSSSFSSSSTSPSSSAPDTDM